MFQFHSFSSNVCLYSSSEETRKMQKYIFSNYKGHSFIAHIADKLFIACLLLQLSQCGNLTYGKYGWNYL